MECSHVVGNYPALGRRGRHHPTKPINFSHQTYVTIEPEYTNIMAWMSFDYSRDRKFLSKLRYVGALGITLLVIGVVLYLVQSRFFEKFYAFGQEITQRPNIGRR